MRTRKLCSILPCLLLLGACSTKPRVPDPVVTSRTVVQQARPDDALLKLCEAPNVVPTRSVRDITDNSTAKGVAFDKCAARFRCLVWWITTANREIPPTECRKED